MTEQDTIAAAARHIDALEQGSLRATNAQLERVMLTSSAMIERLIRIRASAARALHGERPDLLPIGVTEADLIAEARRHVVELSRRALFIDNEALAMAMRRAAVWIERTFVSAGTIYAGGKGPDDAALKDQQRYRYLRERDLDTLDRGGVFAGKTPSNVVLNGSDLDAAIDAAMGEVVS